MQDVAEAGRQEQALLRQSVGLLVLLAATSLVFGVLTGSFAILFDGIYALIDACMGGLALLVSRLILRDALRPDRPGRVRWQFGFWHLEPMVLALNATLLVLAILYALASALILLAEGGSAPDFGLAVAYAAGMTAICLGMGLRQWRRNRRLKSAFVALDAKGWIMSGAISLALLVAFAAGLAMKDTPLAVWQPLVDPAVLALVCLAVLPMPLSDLRTAVRDIFLVAPDDLDARVTAAADRAVAEHGFRHARTYVARVGRSMMVDINFVVAPGWQVGTVGTLDRIRDAVGAEIGEEGPNRWLTIAFTEDPEWAF